MRTTRIELAGEAGTLTIHRPAGEAAIHIESTSTAAAPATRTWRLPATVDDEKLLRVAIEAQYRTDGYRGTNGDVYGYLAEMRRFQS